jgi:VWFA-related protein
MRVVPVAALLSALALPAFPQGKLVETIEVRVANIDVVVRDSNGKPVNGLTKDAFELYENGVRQPITNLYEVRRDADPATQDDIPLEVRQRRMLIFVDSSSLEGNRKSAVLAAVQKFVDDQMRPEDQAMLVSWRLGTRVVAPFTNDKQRLRDGLVALSRIAPGGITQPAMVENIKREVRQLVSAAEDNLMTFPEAYASAKVLVDRHATQVVSQQEETLEALKHMVSTVAGFEGRKVLVFVSEQLSVRPGAEMYRYVDEQFAQYLTAANTLDLQSVGGVMGHSMQARIDDVARHANANGVTIYAIATARTDHEFSAEFGTPSDHAESYSRVSNTASALDAMAGYTGGVSIAHTTNLELAFDTIRRDLDSYYSLGYKPNMAPDGPRKIRVKMKNRDYSVRSRETFVYKTADTQMDDRVIANLFAEKTESEWPIEVRTGPPRPEPGGKFLIPVQVVMPATITLLPQEGDLIGGFILYFAVGTRDGHTSDIMKRPQGLKIPPKAEWAIRAKPMTFNTGIRVLAGESTLSVAILDQISGTTGFARAKIIAH